MHILVFKTNIESTDHLRTLCPILDNHPVVTDWSVDTEDIDKVLRIEHSGLLKDSEVIQLMNASGFHCQQLPD